MPLSPPPFLLTFLNFVKVLKTVQRVLDCLEATYPNLYELPNAGDRRKEDLFERFLDLESLCLEDLRDMKVS